MLNFQSIRDCHIDKHLISRKFRSRRLVIPQNYLSLVSNGERRPICRLWRRSDCQVVSSYGHFLPPRSKDGGLSPPLVQRYEKKTQVLKAPAKSFINRSNSNAAKRAPAGPPSLPKAIKEAVMDQNQSGKTKAAISSGSTKISKAFKLANAVKTATGRFHFKDIADLGEIKFDGNIRADSYSAEHAKTLAKSILAAKQVKMPVRIVIDLNKAFPIADCVKGMHRTRGAIIARKQDPSVKVPCTVDIVAKGEKPKPRDELDDVFDNATELSKSLNMVDKARAYGKLRSLNHEVTWIADFLGVDRKTVERTLKVLVLSDKILKFIAENNDYLTESFVQKQAGELRKIEKGWDRKTVEQFMANPRFKGADGKPDRKLMNAYDRKQLQMVRGDPDGLYVARKKKEEAILQALQAEVERRKNPGKTPIEARGKTVSADSTARVQAVVQLVNDAKKKLGSQKSIHPTAFNRVMQSILGKLNEVL